MRIDLNSDIGEGFGAYTLGDDRAIMRSVTSVNVACGTHAGDPTVMRRTVRDAGALGVALGAHPGFPDLGGFGRREMQLSPGELEDLVLYQIAALRGVADAEGVPLRHVKPHGALYNMASRDPAVAGAIVAAVRAISPELILFGPPGSALLEAACVAGLAVAAEGFADRAYQADGTLVPRSRPGAVIDDSTAVLARAIALARDGEVIAADGTALALRVQTICLHGDTPGAPALAVALRQGLEAAGVRVAAPRDP